MQFQCMKESYLFLLCISLFKSQITNSKTGFGLKFDYWILEFHTFCFVNLN